jgi:hypothetical protein
VQKDTLSRSSSVSIVSDYGLDGRGSTPGTGKGYSSSLCVQTRPETHPVSCQMGTGDPFPGLKRSRRVALNTHPYLVSRSRMSRSYISSLPWLMHGVTGQFYFIFAKGYCAQDGGRISRTHFAPSKRVYNRLNEHIISSITYSEL